MSSAAPVQSSAKAIGFRYPVVVQMAVHPGMSSNKTAAIWALNIQRCGARAIMIP